MLEQTLKSRNKPSPRSVSSVADQSIAEIGSSRGIVRVKTEARRRTRNELREQVKGLELRRREAVGGKGVGMFVANEWPFEGLAVET